jgi:MFS transporter, DHA2 family, multidrug resistance protein
MLGGFIAPDSSVRGQYRRPSESLSNNGRQTHKGPRVNVSVPTRAGRREWIGLAVIALPCVLYAMDLTVLNLAVPAVSAELQPSSSQLLWIVDIYGFLVAGFLITMGTLGDRIGRRRLLLIGAAGFGVASVLAAFSTSAAMLIVARALLGIAGATLAPSTLSLIRSMFENPRERTFAIGVWITSFSAGGALGPLVGGVFLDHFWWGSVFLLAVPVMALLLAVGPSLLPEFRDPDAGRLDLISAAMSLVAVLAVIYGLKEIAQDGIGGVSTLSIVAGLALGTAFLRRQRTLADPLIDLRLFRAPAFSAALGMNTLAFFVAFGIAVFLAQYLQLVLGLSPLQAGLWTVPSAGGFIVGSMVTPLVVSRVRPGLVMVGGFLLSATGFVLLTQIDAGSGLAILVTGSVIFSLGLAPVFTLAADLVVGTAPPERAGAAAAISETSSEFGGALGIALLGAVGSAVYRGRVDDAVPAGVSPEAAESTRDTLGGALAASARLSEPLAADLIEVAREAFTRGLQIAATLSAAVAVGAAVLGLALLRHVRSEPESGQQRELDPDVPVIGGRVALGECDRGPRMLLATPEVDMNENIPGGVVDVNGATIYFEDCGTGPPLMLIHGGLGSNTQWDPVVSELKHEFRVIAPDSRGHGRSTNPDGTLSYSRIADDMAALIAALRLTDPVVCGWSDGGQVALELGARHRGAAGALIIGAAYPDFAASGLREAHRELLGADDAGVPNLQRLDAHLGADAELIKSAHRGGTEHWAELVHQTAPMWLDYAGLGPDELWRIQLPTLVLVGDRDELIPLDLAVALYRALPDSELAICPRTEHEGPTPERAAPFASLIRDFALRHAQA